MIMRLIADTGISELQARELVALLGMDWPSLVREARLLRVSMQPRFTDQRWPVHAEQRHQFPRLQFGNAGVGDQPQDHVVRRRAAMLFRGH